MPDLLRSPDLGPIVGDTTSTTAKIWIRGHDAEGRRSIGVIGRLGSNNKVLKTSIEYFRLHREYDRTGWRELTGLEPNKEYTVKAGALSVESVDSDRHVSTDDVMERLPNPRVWAEDLDRLPSSSEASFRTFPESIPADEEFSFIFGSCRYPGILWQKKRADVIFGAINERIEEADTRGKPRFVLMVGDQIYADTLNRLIPIGNADTEEEFRERYMTAFGSPNMRRLLRSIPHYMILDDHEIEDNWVQGRIKASDKRALFTLAISYYQSYQWSHGPRSYGKNLYYNFECGGYPFFVMDGRTQRMRDDDDQILEDNHMLGYPRRAYHPPEYLGQIDQLCKWLVEQQEARPNEPKFVVSPSVFVPNAVATKNPRKKWKSDSWPAFPVTRKQLLRAIVDNNVQNVVFLSGDVHCSNVAKIRFEKNGAALPLTALSITSSAFYWPFPFADGDPLSFVHDSAEEDDGFEFETDGGEVVMHYNASHFEQEDNFAQVTYSRSKNSINVRNFDKSGRQVKESDLQLS